MAQPMVEITSVTLGKNQAATNEKISISVKVIELTSDSGAYRLPIRLGTERGTVK